MRTSSGLVVLATVPRTGFVPFLAGQDCSGDPASWSASLFRPASSFFIELMKERSEMPPPPELSFFAAAVVVLIALVCLLSSSFREKERFLEKAKPATVVEVQYLPSFREGYSEERGPAKWWGMVGNSQAPYQFAHGGAWPPGMFTRLRQWSPGFNSTSNWMWAFRPGMKFKKWPRSRWVAKPPKLDSYYYINNQQYF